MSKIGTKTKQDAYSRVWLARFSSTANEPTLEYLVELQKQLYSFLGEVNEAISALVESNNQAEDNQESESFSCGNCGHDQWEVLVLDIDCNRIECKRCSTTYTYNNT